MKEQNETNVPEGAKRFFGFNDGVEFSGTFETTPEAQEILQEIVKETSVLTADVIGFRDNVTGEVAEYVSKRKLNEVISKMEELKKDGNSFAECADECIEILRDAMK